MQLSIVVPIYDTKINYLEECLNSIQNSEISCDYEVLLINDGSTDRELVQFLENYNNANTKVFHKENAGVSSARNLGLKNAKGEFILCLDPDDILLPEIEQVINCLQNNPEFDIVYCDIQFFGDVTRKLKVGSFVKIKQIYIGNILAVTSLFRKTILDKIDLFNEEFHYIEDRDFWSRAAVSGAVFKYLPTPFFKYRRINNGKSLSQKHYSDREYYLRKLKSQFDPHEEITHVDLNNYVLVNFREKKKHFVKLFIIIYLPPLFEFLKKKGVFKNNIILD